MRADSSASTLARRFKLCRCAVPQAGAVPRGARAAAGVSWEAAVRVVAGASPCGINSGERAIERGYLLMGPAGEGGVDFIKGR